MMKIQSVVQKRKGRIQKGKGFSRDELKEAKIDFRQALKLAIPIDLRRKTKHEENITALKAHLHKLKPNTKVSKRVRVEQKK